MKSIAIITARGGSKRIPRKNIKEFLGKPNIADDEIKAVVNKIVQEINNKFPNYKHIKEIFIRDKEFEKTTTQKIKRFGDNLKV